MATHKEALFKTNDQELEIFKNYCVSKIKNHVPNEEGDVEINLPDGKKICEIQKWSESAYQKRQIYLDAISVFYPKSTESVDNYKDFKNRFTVKKFGKIFYSKSDYLFLVYPSYENPKEILILNMKEIIKNRELILSGGKFCINKKNDDTKTDTWGSAFVILDENEYKGFIYEWFKF